MSEVLQQVQTERLLLWIWTTSTMSQSSGKIILQRYLYDYDVPNRRNATQFACEIVNYKESPYSRKHWKFTNVCEKEAVIYNCLHNWIHSSFAHSSFKRLFPIHPIWVGSTFRESGRVRCRTDGENLGRPRDELTESDWSNSAAVRWTNWFHLSQVVSNGPMDK